VLGEVLRAAPQLRSKSDGLVDQGRQCATRAVHSSTSYLRDACRCLPRASRGRAIDLWQIQPAGSARAPCRGFGALDRCCAQRSRRRGCRTTKTARPGRCTLPQPAVRSGASAKRALAPAIDAARGRHAGRGPCGVPMAVLAFSPRWAMAGSRRASAGVFRQCARGSR